MNNTIEKIVKELEEKQIFGTKLVDYWKSQNYELTTYQVTELLQILSKKEYIFYWLELICFLLPYIFQSKHFLEIIDNISKKVRGDLAQGCFIDALIHIGTIEPNLSVKIYEEINERYSHNLYYGALLLGGAATVSNDILQTIIEEIPKKEDLECAALIRALRVAYTDAQQVEKSIFYMLDLLLDTKNDEVKREISLAYFDFYKHDEETSFYQLKQLTKSSNFQITYTISNMLSMIDLKPRHLRGFISELSENSNNQILNLVARAIAIKNKTDTVFSLDIIKKWIDKGKYYDINNVNWILNEIGKENISTSLNVVKKWFTLTDYRLFVIGSDILWSLGEHDVRTLTLFLIDWLNEKTLIRVPLEGLRKILSERYKTTDDSDIIVDLIYNALCEYAHTIGINLDKVTKQYDQRIFKCTAIIDELQKEKSDVDYNLVLENLERYGEIKTFLGTTWFQTKISELDTEHPLIIYLSKGFKLNSFFDSFLSHLNSNLQFLESTEPRIGNIRRGLRTDSSFWYTVSEIDVIARLRPHFEVQIEPVLLRTLDGTIKKSRPDIKLYHNSNEILIEVIAPDMFAPLKFFHSAMIVPDRLGNKIYSEFQDHFKGMTIDRDVIMIVDTSHSEIDYYSAENYLSGSFQITFRMDLSSRRVIATYPSRKDDAMHILDPNTKSIIGLVLYKRVIGSDGRIHFQGRVFPNEYVMNEDRRALLTNIGEIFFG